MFAFVFPGQGAQSIGMGRDFYDNFSESRDVFQEVDDTLNQSLSKLIFEGPLEELSLTTNTQPALMAVSIAIFRVLEKNFSLKDRSFYVAGHSLGEYTAHCSVRSFTLKDTAQLLRIRGESMQQAVPVGVGSMAALLGSGGIEKAQELCQAVSDASYFCQVANDNNNEQVVISGHVQAIAKAIEKATEFDFKRAVKLEVSAPFHCSLMEPAAEKMKEALGQTEIQPPQKPLIANVTVDQVTTPDDIRRTLVEQVTGRVRWRESILKLKSLGVTTLIEVGPGRVLSTMCKRIDPDMKTIAIHKPEHMDELAHI